MPSHPIRPGRLTARLGLAAVLATAAPAVALSADAPSPDVALKYVPTQRGVDVDTPEKAQFAKCEVKVERKGKTSGWVVMSPEGQTLRRFIDTNGDNIVDQWRYYKNGIEVYRDVDTNANNKYDQFRWLNAGGSRWGVDANEDGKIDSWKILSAEEASRVAVEAMIAGDYAQLQSVLVSPEDLGNLGVNAELSKQILEAVARPAEQAKAAADGSKLIAPSTTWMRFDSSSPGLIPADEGKAENDLFVYENAMAIVDVGGGQAGLIQIGEMVRIGDVWKLTQVPKPIEGDTIHITHGGLLMQPPAVTPDGIPGSISPKMREMLEALQKLDGAAPQPADGVEAFARYNAERARILRGLVDASESPEDKEMWIRQFADSVSAAVQMGTYPEGLEALRTLESQLAGEKADPALHAFVAYRRLLADYDQQAKAANDEGRLEVQKRWLAALSDFVGKFPKAPDSAEALLRLALAEEFEVNYDGAAKWYDRLAKEHPGTNQGVQAAGALKRIALMGKPFQLTGPSLKGGNLSASDYRGKVLLVLYWSTTCVPCEQDLPLVRALYEQYKGEGFEILGVNLDLTAEPVAPYLAKWKITWPQMHEPGGLESRPAMEYGVVVQPTMILVGRDGNVISRSTNVAEMKERLPGWLKAPAGQ